MPAYKISKRLKHASFILALVLVTLFTMPCQAANDYVANKEHSRRIVWSNAPKYIQEQIKNLVLNCTEGTLTPDKAHIFEYTAPGQLPHYVYDFTAWAKHPLIPNCQNSPPLCGEAGCLIFVYTQIQPDVYKQSLRTYVLDVSTKDISVTDEQGNIITVPGFEMTQGKRACRLLGNEDNSCTLSFTWRNNKFAYYGLGSEDKQPALEPPHEHSDRPEK